MCALHPVLHHKCPPSLSCQWYCVCSSIWGGWEGRGQRRSIHSNTKTITLTCMHTHAHIHRRACTNTRCTCMTYAPNYSERLGPNHIQVPIQLLKRVPCHFQQFSNPLTTCTTTRRQPLPVSNSARHVWTVQDHSYVSHVVHWQRHNNKLCTFRRGIQHWIVTCTQQWEV